MNPIEAKQRLDRLIGRTRAQLYKPIGLAETLFRNRSKEPLDLSQLSLYRRRSYAWMQDVCERLYHRRPDLNSRYWDEMFDPGKFNAEAMEALGAINRSGNGLVETYIYAYLKDKVSGILEIAASVERCDPSQFDVSEFLQRFENDLRFSRSVDKAYEIVVYALFDALTKYLKAVVTLSVDAGNGVLKSFEDFAKLVLGVDSRHPNISQPARLYRVGTANAADAGLDMWANFGPAVQVKHMSLTPVVADKVANSLQADQIVIVCKTADVTVIKAVLNQVGYGDRIRGVITESDLNKWYKIAASPPYHDSLGKDLLQSILREMTLEFPLTNARRIDEFLTERGYDTGALRGPWAVPSDGVEEAEKPDPA